MLLHLERVVDGDFRAPADAFGESTPRDLGVEERLEDFERLLVVVEEVVVNHVSRAA